MQTIIFRSEDTGYTVAVFLSPEEETFRAVGSFPEINTSDTYRLLGDWTNHPRYGRQFKVSHYKRVEPETAKDILKYLSSGVIKGIGPVLAEEIVRRFGKKSLSVMRHEPERLLAIQGIGRVRVQQISKSMKETEKAEEAMVFLRGHDIGGQTATKIYKKYGQDTVRKVKENPYRLIGDIFGIGFTKADQIAQKLGVPHDSSFRLRAALLHALGASSKDGHVFLPLKTLIHGGDGFEGVASLTGVEAQRLVTELSALVAQGDVVSEQGNIYLPRLHRAEAKVAKRLIDLLRGAKKVRVEDIEKQISTFEKRNNVSFATQQRKAIKTATSEGVMLLTGGPGTGKTTTLKGIMDVLSRQGLSVALAAPTGRAAKRMAEATGYDAMTIHRLLKFTVDKETGRGRFKYNEHNPLPDDVVIIDESSMLDIVMMEHLLAALKKGARIIFVGDKDQLPSVGAGNVISDLIKSGVIPVVMLHTIFRQAKESLIIANAHSINMGHMPQIRQGVDRDRDFWFAEANTNDEILRRLRWLYTFHLEQFHPVHDIQVLTPMRRTDVGIHALNEMLQELLNPPAPHKKEVTFGLQLYRVGDKCMIQRNNYDKDVFNGDTGVIVDLDPKNKTISLQMSDDMRLVTLENDELVHLSLSYACSVHKSQGSEWPCVIFVASTSHAIMLQRNLIYTGITRARKQAVIVGSQKAVGIAVRNNKVRHRYTDLHRRLREPK